MKIRTKAAIITTLIAIPALFLGPVIFPPADVGVEPTAAQIPFFMFLGLTDALLLGVGVSFLIFGLPVLRRVSPDSKARAWAMYLAIGYLTVSWWPHLGHARLQRSRPSGAAGDRLPLPPASGNSGRGFGLLLLLPVQELQEREASGSDPGGG